ncbi:MAG TPA: hypothetical protein VJL58_07865 [Pyrinomonadaceae bacterium]|nr:hypothetical protein [Pyrinomonadaceae bacterium]
MKLTTVVFTMIIAGGLAAAGCGGGTEAPKNQNAATNANAAKGNTGSLTTTTPTPVSTTNDAPTLKPVYKAYCAAYVKGDESAVRNSYTKDTVSFFEKDMKADNIKSLIKFLEDDGISNEVCDVKNEIISGDSASAEITTKAYPKGFRVVFEKENGAWKLTNKRPEGSLK